MNLILNLIILTIRFLILIGDIALAILKILRYILLSISKIAALTRKKISIKVPRVKIPIPKINLSRFTKTLWKNLNKPLFKTNKTAENATLAVQKEVLYRKVKKQKSITIFPLPLFIKIKFFLAGVFFSLIFIFLPLLFLIFIQNLPSPKELTGRQIPQTTKIYDRNGALLYQIYATQNRTAVPLSDVPLFLRNATIAVEDKDFYKHPGFDITAIIRSSIENASGRGLQGGSTITQQLIKSALLTPETTVTRKIKEVILAFWAERIYSKEQILELYFNQIPYGGTSWGVEAASEIYFGKHVKDLDLAESAFLAGIPKAPTIYSPFGSKPNLWKKRQKEVLERMKTLSYITEKQAQEAYARKLQFQSPRIPIHAPHFVMYIRDLMEKRYGLATVEKGGLSVTTSLDLKLQEKAQKIVADQVHKDQHLHLTNGAALITNPATGDILAMVGSRDFDDENGGNVNLTTSLRQPGSSIKAVTYSAALSSGFTAASILDDSPVVFPGIPPYRPVNYDGKFHGKVSLRIALANSYNIPAVKVLNQIGIPTMVNLGKRMGIKSWNAPERYGLSITLGGAEVTMLDMATIYGTLANRGSRADINPLLRVTDSRGNVLEEKTTIESSPVLDEGIAFIISNILADNQARALAFGPNSPLTIPGYTVSVKTGTSDNKRDNWTVGYTQSYVVAVWVGNNDNSPMSQQFASGITGAAPIWSSIMHALLDGTPNNPLEPAANIVQKPCIGRLEYFIKGTENSINCRFISYPSLPPSRAQ